MLKYRKLLLLVSGLLPLLSPPTYASGECSSQVNLTETQNLLVVEQASNNNFNKKSITDMSLYMNDKRYIQHTPNGADGIEHLAKFISFLKENMPSFRVERHRALAEGDLVVTQSVDYVNEKAIEISVDWYRVNEGRVTEHWDVVVELSDASDGAQHVAGSSVKPSSCLNRELLRSASLNFVYGFFSKPQSEQAAIEQSYLGKEVKVNHIDNGKALQFNQVELSKWIAQKQASSPALVEIARVIVMGDFSAAHFKWTVGEQSFSGTMLFKFDDTQKITESWLTLLPVPDENTNPRDPVF